MTMRWTEDHCQVMRGLRATGTSWSAIGRHFGVTKNSAQGKGREIGLNNPAPVTRKTETLDWEKFMATQGMLDLFVPVRKPLPVSLVPTFMGVPVGRTNRCQFPMWSDDERPKFTSDGGMLVCGEPNHTGSYCREHARICFTPRRVREAA